MRQFVRPVPPVRLRTRVGVHVEGLGMREMALLLLISVAACQSSATATTSAVLPTSAVPTTTAPPTPIVPLASAPMGDITVTSDLIEFGAGLVGFV